jgi:hypothetical protein
MTVTVGFGELGGFVGWAFVGEGEGLSVGEGDVRTGDLMGLELVEGVAAGLEVGLVLIAQADVQTVAPLHFRSDSEGQQPPISCQREFVIYSCFSLEFGRDGNTNRRKIQILHRIQYWYLQELGAAMLLMREWQEEW